MYLHLSELVYLTFYNDSAIFLNALTNEFKICVGEQYDFLKKYFNKEAESIEKIVNDNDGQKLSIIKNLIKSGLIQRQSASEPHPRTIDTKTDAKGCDHTIFLLPNEILSDKRSHSFIEVVKCLFLLHRVHQISGKKHFEGIVQLLRKEYRPEGKYIKPQTEELNQLSALVNKACTFFYKKTKCLEWSAVFVMLALQRGWACNLVVGVSNYPFNSHAWVECDNQVIADNKSLANDMAKILVEPFGMNQ